MPQVQFHEDVRYTPTSDEWKEHVYTYTYFYDRAKKIVTLKTVVEFDDTRSGTRDKISEEVVEIDRESLPDDASKKLKALISDKQ